MARIKKDSTPQRAPSTGSITVNDDRWPGPFERWPIERLDVVQAAVNETTLEHIHESRQDLAYYWNDPDMSVTVTPRRNPSTRSYVSYAAPTGPPNTPATGSPQKTPIPSDHASGDISRDVSPVRCQADKETQDAGDESLQRYKESLGLGGGGKDLSDPNDPRVCIIESLSLESPDRSPVTIDLSAPGSEATLKDKPFKIKEGVKFTMVAKFRVQHEILSGLQYVQVVKRKGIRVSKDSEMMGSYAPNTDKTPVYVKRFQEEDAPSGMLARGHYNAVSSFVDDDKKTHLTFEWSFDIAKDW